LKAWHCSCKAVTLLLEAHHQIMMLWSFWRWGLPDSLGLLVWKQDGDMIASGRLAYVIKLSMVTIVTHQTGGIEMVSCSRLAQGRLGQSVQSYSRVVCEASEPLLEFRAPQRPGISPTTRKKDQLKCPLISKYCPGKTFSLSP
jgi:hypothetical protein